MYRLDLTEDQLEWLEADIARQREEIHGAYSQTPRSDVEEKRLIMDWEDHIATMEIKLKASRHGRLYEFIEQPTYDILRPDYLIEEK